MSFSSSRAKVLLQIMQETMQHTIVLLQGLRHRRSTAQQLNVIRLPPARSSTSAQSELRSISALGIFTWNSFRIVDWVCSLPEIDHGRIGVTGASGGGT